MRPGERRRRARGFTFVVVLAVIAILGIGLSVAGTFWSRDRQRGKEADLLRVGALYALALAQYRDHSPGSDHRYPEHLEDLLADPRAIRTERYLRRLYPDPMAPARPWGLVRDSRGGIQGVYSQDPRMPLIRVPVWAGSARLPAAASYADWRFLAPEATSVAPVNPGAAQPR